MVKQHRSDNRQKELEAENKRLRKQLAEKDEVIEILKIRRHTFATVEDKYRFVDKHRSEFSVDKLCQMLDICRSGYYTRKNRGMSNREKEEQALLREILSLHQKYDALGLDGIYHLMKRTSDAQETAFTGL